MNGSLLNWRVGRGGPFAILAFGMMLLVGGRCGTQLGMKSGIDVGWGNGLEAECASNVVAQRLEPLKSDMTLRVDGAQ